MRCLRKIVAPCLATLVIASVEVGPAKAEPITIFITAEVVQVGDFGNFLRGAVNVGDVITGSYIYESTTTDTNPAPTVGVFNHTTAPYGMTLNVGGIVFRTDPSSVNFLVEISNNHGDPASDNYLLRSFNNIFSISMPPGTGLPNHISWQLDDPTMTALSSDALPLGPPVLSDWQSVFGLNITSGLGGDDFIIRANVTSAGTTPPEPQLTCDGRTPTKVGGAASEVINGTAGEDVIHGLGGNDVINGRGGNDRICGAFGDDRLSGGVGADRLFGMNGRDRLDGGTGIDRCDGGPGADTTTNTATTCETMISIP